MKKGQHSPCAGAYDGKADSPLKLTSKEASISARRQTLTLELVVLPLKHEVAARRIPLQSNFKPTDSYSNFLSANLPLILCFLKANTNLNPSSQWSITIRTNCYLLAMAIYGLLLPVFRFALHLFCNTAEDFASKGFLNSPSKISNCNSHALPLQWFLLSHLHAQQRSFVLLKLCILHPADHISDDYYNFIITHFPVTGFLV